jgi:hypothetical protein
MIRGAAELAYCAASKSRQRLSDRATTIAIDSLSAHEELVLKWPVIPRPKAEESAFSLIQKADPSPRSDFCPFVLARLLRFSDRSGL